MANTPYMNLDLPVATVTLGPTWATQLNSAFDAVDAHDHTSSKGKQVPSAGININANLDLNIQSLVNALSLQFDSQSTTLSGTTYASSVYVTGGNLYFTNASGTPVQITSGGSIVSVPGTTIYFEAQAVAGDLVISSSDTFVVLSVNTAASRTITLPSASAVAAGRIYIIKDASGSANANAISIVPDGSDTLDGSASQSIDSSYGSLMLIGDGASNWQLV